MQNKSKSYKATIDCESLADTCEDNLAEIEDIMEVPEHNEVTKLIRRNFKFLNRETLCQIGIRFYFSF